MKYNIVITNSCKRDIKLIYEDLNPYIKKARERCSQTGKLDRMNKR